IPITRAGTRTTSVVDPPTCAGAGGTTCQSSWTDGKFYSAAIATGTTIRIGFSLDQLCSTPSSSGDLCGGQAGTNYLTSTGVIIKQNITVNIAVVPDNS